MLGCKDKGIRKSEFMAKTLPNCTIDRIVEISKI